MLLRRSILRGIRFYQRWISPRFPARCRFHPTCSRYGYECFENFSLWRATGKTLWRVLRCQPFHPGGYDPVMKQS